MINNIINFSLNNRFLILVLSVIILTIGVYTSSDMDIDVFPDLTAPSVVVLTESHGMAAEEVERLVTFPIETALNGATDVRRVRSSSAAGISIVWIDFDWGTDIYRARQIVSEKLSIISETLPEGVGSPTLAPQSSIIGEIMTIGITSDSVSMLNLRTIADKQIRQRLLAISGVSQVVVIGGEYKQYQILANPQKMKYYNVSFMELLEASKGTNKNSTGGFLNDFGNEYVITAEVRTTDTTEIGNAVIKMVNDKPIKISDVAQVTIGASPKIGDGYLNGKLAIVMTILKQPDINTLTLTAEIETALVELKTTLPKNITINSEIFKQSDFINTAVNNVGKALIEGTIFVIIILFVFLMSFRTTIISVIAIPVSLLVSVLTLKILGFTINTMSLGGLVIAIGVLVDDAIIDVDNVLKRLKQNALKPENEREKSLIVIFNATKEIRASIINATLIIIVAFIPLFFLSGMEGRMLKPLGIAFIVSLFASLVVSLTLTPVMCSLLLTNHQNLVKQKKSILWVEKMNDFYRNLLSKLLTENNKKSKIVLGSSVGLLLVAIILFFGLGRGFLPEFNEGTLTLSTVSLPGISLDESNKMNKIIDSLLLSIPEVKAVARRTGRAELDEHAQGVFSSETDVPFVLEDRTKDEFMEDVRLKLNSVGGINITIGQPLAHRIDHMLSGTRANIAIKVYGTDLEKMFSIANQVKTTIADIEGLVDLSVEQQVQIPHLVIKPNRELLARYGISLNDFTEYIDVAFAGEKISDVYEGSQSFDLILRYDESSRNSIEDIKNSLIDTYNGKKIPLNYVAEISSETTPNTISRENVQRKVVISANVSGRDLRSVVTDIQDIVKSEITLPEGYYIDYGGQFESEQKASKLLFYTSILAILVIFMLLYQEFKNFTVTALIMINLPLAIIGGIFSIYFSSGILSIPAIIGFITLFGIATRNGILLISRYQSLKEQGFGLVELILKGSADRLTPILMTALTAALALVPLVIAGNKPGNEIQSPMAVVILGGLLTSTLLNIFIIPIIYYLINKKKHEILN